MPIEVVAELTALSRFNPDNYVGHLSARAAAEILRLRGEVEKLLSDRSYIIGWNDGFEFAQNEEGS